MEHTQQHVQNHQEQVNSCFKNWGAPSAKGLETWHCSTWRRFRSIANVTHLSINTGEKFFECGCRDPPADDQASVWSSNSNQQLPCWSSSISHWSATWQPFFWPWQSLLSGCAAFATQASWCKCSSQTHNSINWWLQGALSCCCRNAGCCPIKWMTAGRASHLAPSVINPISSSVPTSRAHLGPHPTGANDIFLQLKMSFAIEHGWFCSLQAHSDTPDKCRLPQLLHKPPTWLSKLLPQDRSNWAKRSAMETTRCGWTHCGTWCALLNTITALTTQVIHPLLALLRFQQPPTTNSSK